MLHVVLYQPQIPPNTGNIARQCVGMAAHLHIVGPIPFDLSDHAIRRAGLDYWPHLALTMHASPDAFDAWLGDRRPWLVTKRGEIRYDHADYRDGDVLIFGSETAGLPAALLDRYADRRIYIPVMGPVRSYNLANSAAIITAQACLSAGLYERRPHSPAADAP
jgi:tRNA (cytidine/uridine-2'-O-)-methyltransferase